MPGDPEIDRDVKSGEEKLWEAVYDNKTDKVEHILNTYLTGRLSPPDGPGIDLNWKCTPRRGVFMPPDGRHNGWTAYHVACAYGGLSGGRVVEQMIDAGCDMDVLTRRGHTAWDLAKMNAQKRVLLILETRASTQGTELEAEAAGQVGSAVAAPRTARQVGGMLTSLVPEGLDQSLEGRPGDGKRGWTKGAYRGSIHGQSFDGTQRTGQLYDQKRKWCVTREYRAPLADMATWGAASASTLQEVETLMATLEKKLDKMYSYVTASPAAAPRGAPAWLTPLLCCALRLQAKLSITAEDSVRPISEQLTPFEQQQVKPRTPEVLATWPGHDYHGKFLPNRIEELEAELRALQEQAAELADDVVEPLGQQLGRSTAALSAS